MRCLRFISHCHITHTPCCLHGEHQSMAQCVVGAVGRYAFSAIFHNTYCWLPFPRAIFCDGKNILHISEAPTTSTADGERTAYPSSWSWLSLIFYIYVCVCIGTSVPTISSCLLLHARSIFSHFLSIYRICFDKYARLEFLKYDNYVLRSGSPALMFAQFDC